MGAVSKGCRGQCGPRVVPAHPIEELGPSYRIHMYRKSIYIFFLTSKSIFKKLTNKINLLKKIN